MDLAIRYAVLSYCPDLTDPDVESRPVALVGVGDEAFGFYVVRMNPGDALARDEVSRSVMNNLPALLQRQLIEGFHEAGPRRLLSWLHDRYRNSIHVSALETTYIPVEGSVQHAILRGTIVPPLLDLYTSVVLGLRHSSSAFPTRQSSEPSDLVAPHYGVTPYQESRAQA